MNDGLDLMPDEGPLFDVRMIFGRVEVDSRIRWQGNRGIGEGRARTYDMLGRLIADTGWEPTGVVMEWPGDEAPLAWWRRLLARV